MKGNLGVDRSFLRFFLSVFGGLFRVFSVYCRFWFSVCSRRYKDRSVGRRIYFGLLVWVLILEYLSEFFGFFIGLCNVCIVF